MRKLYCILSVILLSVAAVSCGMRDDSASLYDVTFNVAVNSVPTKAPYLYDDNFYRGRWYLFGQDSRTDGTYVLKLSGDITNAPVNVSGLEAGKMYKMVFVAVPENQESVLPGENSITVGNLEEATLLYQSQDTQSDHDVFRDILHFTPSVGTLNQTAVLTRQNGALEVRIKNMSVTRAELYLEGTRYMYLDDDNAGRVISEGIQSLHTVVEGDAAASNDVRIRINLLPQDDVSGKAANRLVLYTDLYPDGKEYVIRSSQGAVPVYPNQVTWLTLGEGDGEFSMGQGDINLDDDEWDGWN